MSVLKDGVREPVEKGIWPLREVEDNLADFAGRSSLHMGYVEGKARLLSVDQVLFSMSDGHEGDRDYYVARTYPAPAIF